MSNKTYDGSADWLTNALLVGVHKESELIRDVLYRSPLVDMMTQLIGPNIKLASNQLTFKHPHDTAPYQWHQDNGYGPLSPETAVSCWLAVDKTDELNGCLWIIPGSHRHGIIDHEAGQQRERIANVEAKERAMPIPLDGGECVLFHGSLLHMSKGNFSDKLRRAFFFRYADADAIEVDTGHPRLGKLLRGSSKYSAVTDCSELVCHKVR